jgi:hypothetical protein
MLRAIVNAAPTICGGGGFVYAGYHGKVESGRLKGVEGFVGYLGEYDTNTGWSNNLLVEAGTEQGAGGGALNTQHFEPLAFVPVAAFSGLVGSPGGVGFCVGSNFVGAGGYVNIMNNATRNKIKKGG